MYIFKYPEQAERTGAPWYLRQTAVYHQVRLRDQRSTYVLISPYPNTMGQAVALEWFSTIASAPNIQFNAFGIHEKLFDCYLSNYRSCSGLLEDSVEQLVSLPISSQFNTDKRTELKDPQLGIEKFR